MSETGTTAGKATLNVGGKSHDLPIRKGTLGPDVVDVGKLYADADVFTYDPNRPGYPARKWIGSCSHWIAQALGFLGRKTAVIGTLGSGYPYMPDGKSAGGLAPSMNTIIPCPMAAAAACPRWPGRPGKHTFWAICRTTPTDRFKRR